MKSLLGNFRTVTIIVAVGLIVFVGSVYFMIRSGSFTGDHLNNSCNPPPGVAVDGISIINFVTFNDLNSNGVWDNNEPPMSDVQYYSFLGGGDLLTDSEGKGKQEDFAAGCACDCWQLRELIVNAPEGYRRTTPDRPKPSYESEALEVGFVYDPPKFGGEPVWVNKLIGKDLTPIKIHYASDKRLYITFHDSAKRASDSLYEKLFDVVKSLRNNDKVDIEGVTIRFEPSDILYVCPMRLVETFDGAIQTNFVQDSCRGE